MESSNTYAFSNLIQALSSSKRTPENYGVADFESDGYTSDNSGEYKKENGKDTDNEIENQKKTRDDDGFSGSDITQSDHEKEKGISKIGGRENISRPQVEDSYKNGNYYITSTLSKSKGVDAELRPASVYDSITTRGSVYTNPKNLAWLE